jgi:hypothetical protein
MIFLTIGITPNLEKRAARCARLLLLIVFFANNLVRYGSIVRHKSESVCLK